MLLNSSLVVSYLYDSASRLLQRVEGGTTTNYHWDGWDLVREEKTGTVTETTDDLCPQGEVLAFKRGGDWYYLHGDALSSTQLVTDESGNVVGRYVYGAWGDELSASESIPGLFENRFIGGLGCRRDSATGLVYMRHRWYDCQLQRFVSRDPIGMEGGTNLYEYASNNPASHVDPYGLEILPPSVISGTAVSTTEALLTGGAGAAGGAAVRGATRSIPGRILPMNPLLLILPLLETPVGDGTLRPGDRPNSGPQGGKGGKGGGKGKPKIAPLPVQDPEKKCKPDHWTKQECRDACDEIFTKANERATCYSVCTELGGSGCTALKNMRDHDKRHGSEKKARFHKAAKKLYDHLCK